MKKYIVFLPLFATKKAASVTMSKFFTKDEVPHKGDELYVGGRTFIVDRRVHDLSDKKLLGAELSLYVIPTEKPMYNIDIANSLLKSELEEEGWN